MTRLFLSATILTTGSKKSFIVLLPVRIRNRNNVLNLQFKGYEFMEPQKILIFGLGFIFLAGITLFISFKLQSTIASKKNKNIVNLLSFLFLVIAAIFIFKTYSQDYIAALGN